MTVRKRMFRRAYLIGMSCIITAFFMVPQFLTVSYGTTIASSSGTYDIGEDSYEINTPGTYTFTGETDKNDITVKGGSAGSPVVIHLDGVTINITGDREKAAIDVQGGYTQIYINGENVLTGGHNTGAGKDSGCAGIRVDEDATVELLGNGKLTVQGGGPARGAAGIGSNYDVGEDCGTIIIGRIDQDSTDAIDDNHAPTIIATGGGYQDQCDGGAGIGGGFDGSSGTITIHNGTVTATGSGGAAGIGGGEAYASGGGGQGNNITINGGTVTAKGGDGAAGIGGSDAGSSGSGGDSHNITINGGTVNATGGSCAAGIGGGDGADCYDLTINDGTITAKGGGSGAGIGGGREGYVENLFINGGTINATGGSNAAGIGAGNAKGTGDGGDITNLKITGGNITATGGSAGAGIGGGDSSKVLDLKIEQENEGKDKLIIKAEGGDNGAGIGSASNDAESKRLGPVSITLKGGTINATGGSGGAGIGSGGGSAGDFMINGYGAINATGYDHSSAIGAGDGDTLVAGDGDIAITGTSDTQRLVIDGKTRCSNPNQSSGNDAAVIGSADGAAGNITIENANISLERSYGSMGAAIGTGENNKAMPYAMGSIKIKNCTITEGVGYYSQPGPTIGIGEGSDIDSILIEDTTFEGGAIGGCFNGNETFSESKIDSITIKGSTITAKTNAGIKAAIGSGTYLGVGSITIEDCPEVIAETAAGAAIGSGGYDHDSAYDALRWTGCECGDITISNSTVTATTKDSGAGIGGGWGTSVGDITIENGSEVTATSTGGGSAIGGGHAESCGDITISDSTVKANAAKSDYSAGIGSSGDNDGGAFLWNSTCHSISISGSTVEAHGGKGSAAIGTAQESQFSRGATIEIDDSEVEAVGGEGGAGIGAGSDSWAGVGGEANDITISGASKITATGGIGGAGIGGGCSGGADDITIALDDTVRNSDDWEYYVKAYGGKSAAGIGSGSVYQDSDWVAENGHDTGSVSISGGYVYAQGGNSKAGYLGPGAGIGGGAHGGNLNGFDVSGGFIEAHAGAQESREGKANDIGSGGGNDTRPLAEDEDFKITGGTVLGGLSDDPKTITVDGGSVIHKMDNAVRSDGTSVYQTTMQIMEPYHQPLEFNVTSFPEYGVEDIFSDSASRIYLYLPESQPDAAKAQYAENGTTYQYYGTTKTDGWGWLKMGGTLTLKGPIERGEGEPIVGDTFAVTVEEAVGLSPGNTVNFALQSDKQDAIKINGTGQNTAQATMPDAKLELTAKDRTGYTVTASTEGLQSDLYWDMRGTYASAVTKEKGEIKITGDPSKVYDGQPAAVPAVEHNSNAAAVMYTYYRANGGALGAELSGPPKDAGSYFVVASIEGTDNYTAAESDPVSFEIKKRPFFMEIDAEGIPDEGSPTADVSVTVTAFGILQDDSVGTVKITGTDTDNPEKSGSADADFAPAASDGTAKATATFTDVAGNADYNVKAQWSGGNTNYACSDEPTDTYHKNYGKRSIQMSLEGNSIVNNTIETTYLTTGYESKDIGWGEALDLKASTDNINDGYDKYTYELVYDQFQTIFDQAKPAIGMNWVETNNETAQLTYQNAGEAIIRVTLKDTAPANQKLYDDSITYVRVVIKPATVKVTPFAYKEGGDSGSHDDRINSVTYGSLDTIAYGLEYTDTTGSTSGEMLLDALQPVPLNETTGVGSHQIKVALKEDAALEISNSQLRNYRLEIAESKIAVSCAPLKIKVADQVITYGIDGEPEYTCSFGDTDGSYGLMPWDASTDVVKFMKLKQSFSNYKPSGEDENKGIYKNAITIEEGASAENYTWVDERGGSLEEGDLTVNKGYVSIDAVISSKVYDNNAVSADVKVEPINTAGLDTMAEPNEKVTYYKVDDNGAETEISSAPVDAGKYVAAIEVTGDPNYENAKTKVEFRIRKARSKPDIPQLEDIRMKDGLTLSDQEIPNPGTGTPDGGTWTWLEPNQKLEPGLVSAHAEYTPNPKDVDSGNYLPAVKLLTFNVYEKEKGSIEFVEDPSKVYDGDPVNDPAVNLDTDAGTVHGADAVQYEYYDITDKNNPVKLDEAPSDTGKYRVVASVKATGHYSAAQAEMDFTITKRPVALQLTAKEEKDPSNPGNINVTMTVTVLNAEDIEDAENAVIDLTADVYEMVKNDAPADTLFQGTQNVTMNEEDQYTAIFTFARSESSNYIVTAEFPATRNHYRAKTQQSFDATYSERALKLYDVEDTAYENPIQDRVLTRTYGNPEVTIVARPDAVDSPTSSDNDEYTFEIVSDSSGSVSDPQGTSEEAIIQLSSVANHKERQKITFKNAGTAIVKVTVTNEGYPSDAVAYLTVTVAPVEVTVHSYAYAGDSPPQAEPVAPLEVTYGSVGDLNYGLYCDKNGYAGHTAGNTCDICGALQAVPLNKTTGVGTYPIDIIPVGNSDTNKRLLRNYEIEKAYGKLTITKASLTVAIEDTTTKYGIAPTFEYDLEGLAEWDRAGDVIRQIDIVDSQDATKVITSMDTNGGILTGGMFPSPGTYQIDPKLLDGVAANPNYDITDGVDGNLTIGKGTVEVSVRAMSKDYDGKEADISTAVKPVLSKNIKPEQVVDPVNYAKTKYRVGNGLLQWDELSAAPVNAGTYIADITISENTYYENSDIGFLGNDTRTGIFEIRKIPYPVATPKLPNMVMRDGLKLSDQQLPKGWKWMHPDKPLSVGTIQEYAVYTLTDELSINYIQPEPVLLTFNVYVDPAAGDDSEASEEDSEGEREKSDGDGNLGADDGSAGTGDETDPTLWGIIMMAAVFAAAMTITLGRRKEQ